ncbi:MAG: hypothetical protein GXP03_04750 [Alphaproteobacteria bacterium]|nr:hypothetical protein [Alphaproteobacteria bacterium]
MLEHEVLQYDLTAAGGEAEHQASIEHMMKSFVGPDERRKRFAAAALSILETNGLPDPGVAALDFQIYGIHGEESMEYIAAYWLMAYNRLCREREVLASSATAPDLELLIMFAEELGQYQERMVWRQGLDEKTGKRREALALSGRKQVKDGQDGNRMRTNNSFFTRHGKQAQEFVEDLHQRKPNLTWADMRRQAAKKFGVSPETIKEKLNNPKRVG